MKKYIAAFVLLVVLGLALSWKQDSLLRLAGSYISPNDTVTHADAIAVLSGGTPARMLEALDLFNTNWSDRILLTRGPDTKIAQAMREHGLLLPSEPEFLLSLADENAVPRSSVTILDQPVTSTFDEARLLLRHMRRTNKNALIVVTSPYHTRRCKFIFGKLFAPYSIKVMARATTYDDFDRARWWKDRRSLRSVIFEYQKYLFYRIFYSFARLPETDRHQAPGTE